MITAVRRQINIYTAFAAMVPKEFLAYSIWVWMQFFVPQGATYDDVIVEFKHEGVPRHLTAYKVQGSIRYRVADRYKVDKPGKWTITIKRGMTSLKEFAITVVKK